MLKKLLVLSLIICSPLPLSAAVDVQEVKAAGLTVWLAEDHHLPIIELRMLFKGAGYASDSTGKHGRASLAAELLTQGAGDKDSGEFQRALEAKAISLGVSSGRDNVSLSLQTLSEHRDAAFALMADALLRPRFDDTSLQEAKKLFAVQRQRQQESSHYLADNALRQKIYAGHPYSQESLGSDESMAALGKGELEDYVKTHLTKDNVIISVSGGITPSQLKKLLVKYFKKMPEESSISLMNEVVFDEEQFEIFVKKQKPQSLLSFVRSGVSRDSSDFYAAYLLNHIVGGASSLTSRLGQEVRKKRGLSYGIGTALEQNMYSNLWAGSVATQTSTADEAKQVILQTFAQLADTGVSAQELASAKSYIKGSFPLKIASNGGVVGYLASMQLYGLGRDYFTRRNELFEAVDLAHVNTLAKEYFAPDSWSWVRVGAAPDKE